MVYRPNSLVANTHANLLEQNKVCISTRVQVPQEWFGTPYGCRVSVFGQQHGYRVVMWKQFILFLDVDRTALKSTFKDQNNRIATFSFFEIFLWNFCCNECNGGNKIKAKMFITITRVSGH